MHFFLVARALKAERFVQLVVGEKVREIQNVSRTPGSPAGAEMEGHKTRDAGGLRNGGSGLTAIKKCERQSYNHKELTDSDNLKATGSRFSSRVST